MDGLDENTLQTKCKIGQGEQCCRYIILDNDGFHCGKSDPVLRKIIDSKLNDFHAKSDNCNEAI